jgi:GNAT superfamily N-acetyltransferase
VTGTLDLTYGIRPYDSRDEAGVLDLLRAALGEGPTGSRSAAFFRWKHLENPFGPSFMLVAEADDRIIGFRALMRWEFRAGDRTLRAVRPVDTATHPDYQGHGVFSRLTKEALRGLEGKAHLVFNTPNRMSLPGYEKLGWTTVGNVPVSIRIRHPIRFARRARQEDGRVDEARPVVRAASASEVLAEGAEELLGSAERGDQRLRTPRDIRFLRWRYGSAPALDYRAVREIRGGVLCGFAVFRVRPRGRLWESTIADLIVREGDARTARRLLRRVVHAADVDHLTCSFPGRSVPRRAAGVVGFLRSPRGMTLVAKPLRSGVVPDPTTLGSWALCLGDLEVF